jgi:hypothetical protein
MIHLLLCSEDAKALYSVTKRIEPYAGAKKVDIFITTHIDYSKELITKEIEKKIDDTERRRNLNVKEISKIAAKKPL